jgi:hypothetical protein
LLREGTVIGARGPDLNFDSSVVNISGNTRRLPAAIPLPFRLKVFRSAPSLLISTETVEKFLLSSPAKLEARPDSFNHQTYASGPFWSLIYAQTHSDQAR